MLKILVVDDEAGICHLIERILEADGHYIDTCNDGNTAMEKLSETFYDLIIMDVFLPGTDGLDLATNLRQGALTMNKNTPIIAITGGQGKVSTETSSFVIEAVVDIVLQKPFDFSEMKANIARLCPAHETEQTNIDS